MHLFADPALYYMYVRTGYITILNAYVDHVYGGYNLLRLLSIRLVTLKTVYTRVKQNDQNDNIQLFSNPYNMILAYILYAALPLVYLNYIKWRLNNVSTEHRRTSR